MINNFIFREYNTCAIFQQGLHEKSVKLIDYYLGEQIKSNKISLISNIKKMILIKKYIKSIGIYIVIIFVSFGCQASQQDENEKTFIIKEHLVDCVGVTLQQCILVKEEDSQNWEYFYDDIEGFEYKENYRYTILVKVKNTTNISMDASSKHYKLIKIIDKIFYGGDKDNK